MLNFESKLVSKLIYFSVFVGSVFFFWFTMLFLTKRFTKGPQLHKTRTKK